MVVPRGIKSRISSTRVSAFSASTERPPVILEWTSCLIRVGYAEQHKPQHVIPWTFNKQNTSTTNVTTSLTEWYQTIGPLLTHIWRLLMTAPSTRRVVVLHPPYMERTWELAMMQGLYNLGVPAVVLINSLETVHLAMAGWSRGMVVQVGMKETWCMAHVDGHALHNTLQVVPTGYDSVAKPDGKVQIAWTLDMDMAFLNERNPESIVMALVKSLDASSMEVRRDVISNIIFCGDAMVLVPDLGRRVVERLRNLLQQQADHLEEPTNSELTIVPGSLTTLAPLASAVQGVSTMPNRADTVAWTGASLWASVWHRRDEDDEHVPWKFAPQMLPTHS